MWIVRLDSSKAFDNQMGKPMGKKISEHGVSDQMLWALQCIYYGQTGRIGNNSTDGDWR